jgi:hypothetical protein
LAVTMNRLPGSAAGLPVERRQLAARFVDCIGADLVEIGVDRVEKPLSMVDGEKRGIDQRNLSMPPGPRGRIYPVDTDAVPRTLRFGVVEAPTYTSIFAAFGAICVTAGQVVKLV